MLYFYIVTCYRVMERSTRTTKTTDSAPDLWWSIIIISII